MTKYYLSTQRLYLYRKKDNQEDYERSYKAYRSKWIKNEGVCYNLNEVSPIEILKWAMNTKNIRKEVMIEIFKEYIDQL